MSSDNLIEEGSGLRLDFSKISSIENMGRPTMY